MPWMCRRPSWTSLASNRPPCSTACRKKPWPGPASSPPSTASQAPEVRTLQYYELYGSRALYLDGWKAVTFHPVPGVPSDGPGDPNLPFTQDKWELYNVAQDFAEVHDLAAQEPERLQLMINLWFAEAGKYDVFPIHAYQRKAQRPKPGGERDTYIYWPHTTHIDNEAAVNVRMRPLAWWPWPASPRAAPKGCSSPRAAVLPAGRSLSRTAAHLRAQLPGPGTLSRRFQRTGARWRCGARARVPHHR